MRQGLEQLVTVGCDYFLPAFVMLFPGEPGGGRPSAELVYVSGLLLRWQVPMNALAVYQIVLRRDR